MSPPLKRLGVLISGRGSNLVAIADAIAAKTLNGCEIAVVLSNVPGAAGLAMAQFRGLSAVLLPSAAVPRDVHDARMLAALEVHRVEYVLLAGYMRVLTPTFVRAYPERILNVHPSLLPAFPGLHAQRQALEHGSKLAGCTVHLVDEAVDHGTILLQRSVPVLDGDTVESLSARILVEEHKAYPEAVAQLLSGLYHVQGRRWVQRSTPPGPHT